MRCTEGAIHALDLLVICQVCLSFVDSDNWVVFPLAPLAQEANIGESRVIGTLRRREEQGDRREVGELSGFNRIFSYLCTLDNTKFSRRRFVILKIDTLFIRKQRDFCRCLICWASLK